jgi:hypothetical protein
MSIDITSMLDSFPEGWRPSPGDKLIGVVIGLETRVAEYGEYPIVSVRTDGGQDFAFHAYHTVARRELEKLQPQLGDRIGIAYHGPHPTKGYERYRIIIVRRAGEVTMDDAPPADGPERAAAGDEDAAPPDEAAPEQDADEPTEDGDEIPF